MIIIGICLIIIIVTEFFFQEINIFLTYSDFINALLLNFICQIFGALIDAIEKYLYEYDYLNPFYTLMYEGIFGFFMSLLYFLIPNYLDDIIIVYKTFSAGKLVLFTFLLILYIILCAGRNAFRVITTKLYSPMARALTDYFLNPIYHIYDFGMGNDFLNEGERDVLYFIINLFISLIISICGCVYNEFMVLFFCGLERDTYDQISKRSSITHELIKISEDLGYDDELSECKDTDN